MDLKLAAILCSMEKMLPRSQKFSTVLCLREKQHWAKFRSQAFHLAYGVELDSITGRIAKKLYPQADITVAGFETTDRRDFYDLAVGNVPFGQYRVNDKAYNKLGFSIHNYFFAKAIDQIRPGGYPSARQCV